MTSKENVDSTPVLLESQSQKESRDAMILRLASTIQNVKTGTSKKRAQVKRNTKGISYASVVKNIKDIDAWITTAYHTLKETEDPDLQHIYASEWLMDNFYLVTRTFRLIKEDISSGFYKGLPKIEGGPQDGFARVFVVAYNTLAHENLLFDAADFEQILKDLQTATPLQTDEIWAFPIFLRISLLESLADTLRLMINPKIDPPLPVPESPSHPCRRIIGYLTVRR